MVVDVNFLIQYKQLLIIIEFLKNEYINCEIETLILDEADQFLVRGLLDKCSASLEVFLSYINHPLENSVC